MGLPPRCFLAPFGYGTWCIDAGRVLPADPRHCRRLCERSAEPDPSRLPSGKPAGRARGAPHGRMAACSSPTPHIPSHPQPHPQSCSTAAKAPMERWSCGSKESCCRSSPTAPFSWTPPTAAPSVCSYGRRCRSSGNCGSFRGTAAARALRCTSPPAHRRARRRLLARRGRRRAGVGAHHRRREGGSGHRLAPRGRASLTVLGRGAA